MDPCPPLFPKTKQNQIRPLKFLKHKILPNNPVNILLVLSAIPFKSELMFEKKSREPDPMRLGCTRLVLGGEACPGGS